MNYENPLKKLKTEEDINIISLEDSQLKRNEEDIFGAKPKDFEHNMKVKNLLGHSGPITALDLNYDDQNLISASLDCTIRLWNLELGQCIAYYKSHIRTIWALEFDPRGFHFASGGVEGVIFIWSTNKRTIFNNMTFF